MKGRAGILGLDDDIVAKAAQSILDSHATALWFLGQ